MKGKEMWVRKKAAGLAAMTALLLGVCSAEASEETADWRSEYMKVMMNISDYYTEQEELIASLADLNNDGTPELIVMEEYGGGIMVGNPFIFYLTEEGVERERVWGMEDAYSMAVYCDTVTGEECFISELDCLSFTQPGETVSQGDFSGICQKIVWYGDGTPLAEEIAFFADYAGQTYTQEMYEAYQEVYTRYQPSAAQRYQRLTNNLQLGTEAAGQDFAGFLSSYQSCSKAKEFGAEIKELQNLLGESKETVEAYFGKEWVNADPEACLYWYMPEFFYSPSVMCDLTGGSLQSAVLDMTIPVGEEGSEMPIPMLAGELNKGREIVSMEDNEGGASVSIVWESDEGQIVMSAAVFEEATMISVQLYRTEEIAKGNGASSDWKEAYRTILLNPEEQLQETEIPNGWNFQLIDLNVDKVPELITIRNDGARGISTEIRVFTYHDMAAMEVPMKNSCDFSGLGAFGGYRNQETGELMWLMNMGSFQSDSLTAGGYLESSAGQGGIAKLGMTTAKGAVVSPFLDVQKEWGIEAIAGGAVLTMEPWQENCITEEIWDRIQTLAETYELTITPPTLYVSYTEQRAYEEKETLWEDTEEFLNSYE